MLKKLPDPSPPLGRKPMPSAPLYRPMWDDEPPLAPPGTSLSARPPALMHVVEPDEPPPSEPVFSLQDASNLLRTKALELLGAGPARVSQLNVDIQKLRIICMVLREVELGVSDPNTYKELSLMNKMLTGKDLEVEDRQTAEDEAQATAALESRGIKADSAARMMRALTSIMLEKAAVLPDDEPDETEPPDSTR